MRPSEAKLQREISWVDADEEHKVKSCRNRKVKLKQGGQTASLLAALIEK